MRLRFVAFAVLLSVATSGQKTYFPGANTASFKSGSREAILAQYYSTNFGGFYFANNGGGRLVQLGTKIFF